MTSPRILLTGSGIHPKKQLGQNFLVNTNTSEAILRRMELKKTDCVLEIGPGLGGLTLPMARVVKCVWAVEKDPRMVELLQVELQASGIDNVHVHLGDVLNTDFRDVADQLGQTPVVIGNLPYNLSSQILVRVMKNRRCIHHAVFMFQKELANRLMAPPGTRDYGRITVMLHYCASVHPLMELNANQFYPRPKIDSTILDIRFLDPPAYPTDDESFLFDVIKAAFGKRRKTLRNALFQSDLGITTQMSHSAIVAVGIDPNARAETLTVADFVRLSRHLAYIKPQEDSLPIS